MVLRFKKENAFANLAFLYWFFENAKYGICLALFGNTLNSLYGITAGYILLILGLTLVILLLCKQSKLLTPLNITPKEIKLLIVFFILAGISFFWTNMFAFNFAVWGNIVISVIIFFVACRYAKASVVGERALWGYIAGAAVTAIITLTIHPIEVESIQRLGLPGVLDATRLGRILSFAALFGIFFALKAKSKITFFTAASLTLLLIYTLILTFAKVSILGFLLCSLLMVSLSNFAKRKKILLLLAVNILTTLILFTSYDRFIGYTQLQGGSALQTFSGRTILWLASWDMIKRNPIIGYGSGARLDEDLITIEIESYLDIRPTQAHNEWLNMWFQYGIVGLTLALLIYGYLLRRSFSLYQLGERKISLLCIVVLIFTLIRSPFEADLVGFILPEPFIILFAFWMSEQDKLLNRQFREPQISEGVPQDKLRLA